MKGTKTRTKKLKTFYIPLPTLWGFYENFSKKNWLIQIIIQKNGHKINY